ncbi:MAG: right-handed parallel beta-helix repeat-containing protein [Bacteroidales bacterium]|nr:right-handed parallel beta-helix repeat-containing protein [Bacteroidales bacterium]
MKARFLLLSVATLAASVASAAEYYVVPGIKATGNDGASWDTAITMYDIFENEQTAKKKTYESKYKHGDVFFLAGGTYYNQITAAEAGSEADDRVRIYRGYTFVGGCDRNAGPVTTWPTYPSATPTIFSGDLNENGIADEGDLTTLLTIRQAFSKDGEENDGDDISTSSDYDAWAAYATAHACTVIGIDFTCAYYPELSNDASGALHITQGSAIIKNCNFYGNVSGGKCGAVHNRGGIVHLIDCNVYDNQAATLGGGVRSTTRSSAYAQTVIERCYIANNTVTGKYAGGVAFSSGRNMWIVNSTITGNSCQSDGGGVSCPSSKEGDIRHMAILNTTITGNKCTAEGDWVGSQMVIGCDPVLHMANNIIVDANDQGTAATAPIVLKGTFNDTPVTDFLSYGGSLLGSAFWRTTEGDGDDAQSVNKDFPLDLKNDFKPVSFTTAFAGAVAQDNGGFTKTIIPVSDISYTLGGYPLYGFEPNDCVTNWKANYYLPYEVDLSVDQTGTARYNKDDINNAGDTAPGAYDTYATHLTNGVKDIVAEKAAQATLRSLGNARYAIDGSNGSITVVNIAGARVNASVAANTVDLSGLAKGIYIITTGNQSFKVIR